MAGFSTRTDATGRFKFTYPAPAMWGISYRVVSGRLATPAHKFHAKSQEVVLSVGGDDTAEAGDPFVVGVDTTPNLSGRQDRTARGRCSTGCARGRSTPGAASPTATG